MQGEYQAHEGYLLLADISGYTKFLTGTELEHAQAIIHELTVLVRERLAPPMKFVKVEGDAVFCLCRRSGLPKRRTLCRVDRGVLLRLLQSPAEHGSQHNVSLLCVCGDRRARLEVHMSLRKVSSSTPNAHGVDLAGPDVILAHRLLKNTVSQSTEVEAYALLTDACLARLPDELDLPAMRRITSRSASQRAGVHDLKPVADAMRDARLIYVGPDDADSVFSFEVPIRLLRRGSTGSTPSSDSGGSAGYSVRSQTGCRATRMAVSGRVLRCTAAMGRGHGRGEIVRLAALRLLHH
jgi:hypothetical protein